MTDVEKLGLVKTLLSNDENIPSDEVLLAYLDIARHEIIGWRYSYAETTIEDVPSEYEMTQVYAVLAGFSQSGAEGELSHSENGISRTWKHADMIAYIRAHVIPIARAI